MTVELTALCVLAFLAGYGVIPLIKDITELIKLELGQRRVRHDR
jgi:hypothetical protein